MPVHHSLEELKRRLADIEPSPRDSGSLEMIVIRPETDARDTPETALLTSEEGVAGDRWARGDDPYPEAQVTLINSRVVDMIAGERERWKLAGDNLVVDLDLSQANLPAGTRLSVGSAILEMTSQPHTGCAKFSGRFGADALRFVNLGDGPSLRLRGAYARVVEDGEVSVGDSIKKI